MPDPKGFLVTPVAFRSDGTLRPLVLTDDDYLKVAFAAAAHGLVGEHGWIGGAWQKNPLLMGYSDVVAENFGVASLTVATGVIYATPVPAGEVHVITTFSARNLTSSGCTFMLWAEVGPGTPAYARKAAIAVYDVILFTGMIVLKEGDRLYVTYASAQIGDNIVCYSGGWKFDIDQ